MSFQHDSVCSGTSRKAEMEKADFFLFPFSVSGNLNENWLGGFAIFQLHLYFRNSSTEHEWKLYFPTTSSQDACGEAELRPGGKGII